jgi:hypothetical protein
MALGIVAGVQAAVGGQAGPPLQALVQQATDSVASYEKQFSGLVSEEHYAQVVRVYASTTARRVLRSDVVFVHEPGAGWYGFRDVFEVNGTAVRDRDQRLTKLFVDAGSDVLARANAIVAESARFNVGSITRNINLPTLALSFFRRENLGRSRFSAGGVGSVDGARARILAFQEIQTPSLIKTPDGAAAKGRVWLAIDDGRVLQTELTIDSVAVLARVLVTYGPQDRLPDVLVPVRMDEQYRVGPREVITGSATYSNFRAFNVDVTIKR